jgi:hypothetical protein
MARVSWPSATDRRQLWQGSTVEQGRSERSDAGHRTLLRDIPGRRDQDDPFAPGEAIPPNDILLLSEAQSARGRDGASRSGDTARRQRLA